MWHERSVRSGWLRRCASGAAQRRQQLTTTCCSRRGNLDGVVVTSGVTPRFVRWAGHRDGGVCRDLVRVDRGYWSGGLGHQHGRRTGSRPEGTRCRICGGRGFDLASGSDVGAARVVTVTSVYNALAAVGASQSSNVLSRFWWLVFLTRPFRPVRPRVLVCSRHVSVSYTHLTLPTNREV